MKIGVGSQNKKAQKELKIFCDIDGTLVDDFGNANEKNIVTIKKAPNMFALCTGRSVSSTFSFMDAHDLRVDSISANGSACIIRGTEYTISKFNTEKLNCCLNYVAGLQIPFIVHAKHLDFIPDKLDIKRVSNILAQQHVNCNDNDFKEWVRGYESIFLNNHTRRFSAGETHMLTDSFTIETFPLNLEQEKSIRGFVKLKMMGYDTVKSYATNLEILPHNTSKANGVNFLLKKTNFNGVTVGIGDSQNDQSLLERVDLPFIVNNSVLKNNNTNIVRLSGNSRDFFLEEILQYIQKGDYLCVN